MANMVSPVSRSQGNEFLNKLEAAGLNSDLAQKVVDSKDNDLATKVVKLIANGGFEPSTSQKRAREIMGRNFFGVEEAIEHFRVNPTKSQLAVLAEIPFTEGELEAHKNTHVLVAVFPLSILEVRGIARKLANQTLFYEQDWYNGQAFAKDKGEISWRLVYKKPVANSTSKTWAEQQALLSKEEETPKAQVMVYAIIGHFLATGERMFENVYVRCSSLDSGGSRVDVGDFDDGGLRVAYSLSDDCCDGRLGVASSRKFQD